MSQRGWSFDEATPSSQWDTFGASVLTGGGRRGTNGAQISSALVSNSPGYSPVTEAWAGVAALGRTGSSGIILRITDNEGTPSVTITLEFIGDSRLQLTGTSWLGSPVVKGPLYADVSASEWFYFEVAGTAFSHTRTDHSPSDGLTDITIAFSCSCYVNGVLLSSASYSAAATVAISSLPTTIGWNQLVVGNSDAADDVYSASSQLGDVNVDSSDTISTPPPPTVARDTQHVLEYNLASPAPSSRDTQHLLEWARSIVPDSRDTQHLLEVLILRKVISLATIAGSPRGGATAGSVASVAS